MYIEEWKDIKGYEEYYEVSSLGHVRNKKTHKCLIGDKNTIGYQRVILYQPTKKRFFIHRLVALHFVDGFKEGLVVNHIDGNKQNNNKDNLEWVTRSENDLHAYRLGLRKVYPCQFKHHIESYDLTTLKTLSIYENVDKCAEVLQVTRTPIYSCCTGKQKSCKGVGLRYV